MYQPTKYSKNNRNFIFNFIKNNPFATMVSKGQHLVATHIPVLVEGNAESFRLYAHIANHNVQLNTLTNSDEFLFIFQGSSQLCKLILVY